ncbi:MAG: preprotein translocase subunit YajC [Vicinamibacteria bacterium]|nr:preprotein translocase subunit YajC [Vicinamibacteria bacterium]
MILLALANPPASQPPGSQFSYVPLLLMIVAIFYFIVILPTRKQKQQESMLNALKPGEKIIINPGIFATVVGVDKDSVVVRVDDHTKIRVLKSAVAGPQQSPAESTKEKR